MATKALYIPIGIKSLAIIVFAVVLWGCPPGGGDPPPPPPASGVLQSIDITSTPNSTIVALLGKKQFLAKGNYSDGTTQNITASVIWTTFATTIATVNGAGLVSGQNQGTTILSAVSTNGIQGTSSLTVEQPASIAVTPLASVLDAGTTQQFTATGTFSSNNSTQDFTSFTTFTSSLPSVATISATTAGLATGVSVGTTTIKAKVGAVEGSTSLQVTNVKSVTVAPASSDAVQGITKQFSATAQFFTGPDQVITSTAIWSSSSAIVTINSSGLATVGNATTTVTVTITAAFQGKIGTASLKITPSILQAISVTPPNPFSLTGLTQQFTATGQFDNGPSRDITANVTWGVATGTSVTIDNTGSNKGKATATATGTTTISATFGSIVGTTTMKVFPGNVTTLTIIPVNTSIAKKTKRQFTAKATFDTGGTYDVTSSVAWTSTATSTATIDASSGIATAGASAGTTTIQAVFQSTPATTTATTTLLTVTNATLTQVSVTPVSPTIHVGITKQFTATGAFSDNTTQDLALSVSWSSSQPVIATVDNGSGLVRGETAGSSTITAATNLAGETSQTGSTTVTVDGSALQSLSITPVDQVVTSGTTKQFNVTGVYGSGSTEDLTNFVGWSSSDNAKASISVTGLATGLAVGTNITIKASFLGKEALTSLEVTDGVLTSIVVLPVTNNSIPAGITRQYKALGVYESGSAQDITNSVLWGSSLFAIVTINNLGLATAISVGSAEIKATFGDVFGTTTLAVNDASLTGISVIPSPSTIGLGTTLKYTATANYSVPPSYNVTAFSNWSSSDASKATVDATGLATATGVTSTSTPVNISATFGTTTGLASLNVIPLSLASITVTPANATMHQGETLNFKAEATYNEGGIKQDFTDFVIWQVDNFATVSNSAGSRGQVTAVTQGENATITVVYGANSGSTTLTVTDPVPSDIAMGKDHTCVRLTNGNMRCWGNNASGQVGNNGTKNANRPAIVSGSGVASLMAAGGSHTCSVFSNSTINCWGNNANGQLGNGTTMNEKIPKRVNGVLGATVVKAGGAHTCAVFESGVVKCWGANNFGQLGNSSNTESTTPVSVNGLIAPEKITAGTSHTCALSGALVQCWGDNSSGQLGSNGTASSTVPQSVPAFASAPTAISAGGAHTCAMLSNMNVMCWGKNDKGQLGNNTTTNSTSPVPVSNITTAIAISAGGSHTCALLTNGTVQCWGDNSSGQLGNLSTTDSLVATTTALTGGLAVSAGGSHTCALLANASLQCWGENKFGQVGNGERPISKKPIAVPGIAGASAVGAGQRSTCVNQLNQQNETFCLGDNEFGQIGNGTNLATSTPSFVGGTTGATGLTVGRFHACAIVAGGLKCWGNNGHGQLGNGTNNNIATTSVAVKAATGPGELSGAKSVSAGQNHTCAVLTNQSVLCWGDESVGQLGNNSNESDKMLPVSANGLSSDIVSSGETHTCSLLSSTGGVSCWGNNESGQLGAESPSPKSLVPLAPVSGVDAVVLSAGGKHSCVILATTNSVKCWGSNAFGQMGVTPISDSRNPLPNTVFNSAGNALIASSTAQSITAGPKHTCVILPDGKVNCWGDNEFGQLGNGTTNATSTPGFVKDSLGTGDLTGVIAISASGSDEIEEGSHTCAIMSDRTMQCWGDGFFGQIGSAFKAVVEQPTTVNGLF
jgi:alpha-tubulin suppressor-like RCC1 family protein